MADDKKKGATIVIKKVQGGGHGAHGGAWKVAYADFVTAMMCFFMVMWLMGSDEETKAAIANYFSTGAAWSKTGGDPKNDVSNPTGHKEGLGESNLNGMQGLFPQDLIDRPTPVFKNQIKEHKDLTEAAEEILDDQVFGIDVNVDTMAFSVPADLFFEKGSTKLKTNSERYLDRLGKLFSSYTGYVTVEGHTDGDTPPENAQYQNNYEYSLARAVSIMNVMVKNRWIQEERIFPIGRGSQSAYTPNRDPSSQEKNKRITFYLSKKKKF